MHAPTTETSVRHALWTTPDGARLAATVYEPAAPPRGSLLVAPAVGVPQGFYARFARHAASEGLVAITFDYRGFGKSRRSPGPSARLDRWGELDFPTALRFALGQAGSLPVYVVGHSLGGQYLGLAEESKHIAGAATVASMSGYVGNFEHDRRRVELAFRYAVPALTAALPEVPGWLGLGATMPSGAMRQWARWCLSPSYFLSEHPEYAERVARFAGPLTIWSFEDDRLAPRVNVQWLVDFYRAAKPRHVHLAPAAVGLKHIGHMGFFRAHCQPLWSALLTQLERHDPAFVPRRVQSSNVELEQAILEDLRHGTG